MYSDNNVYIFIYNSIPPSWPENNLPKQVTRKDFHLRNIFKLWRFSNAFNSQQKKTNKQTKETAVHKNATKRTNERNHRKNVVVQILQPFDVIRRHLQKGKNQQLKLNLGVQDATLCERMQSNIVRPNNQRRGEFYRWRDGRKRRGEKKKSGRKVKIES